jgi:hypothetical protein
VAAAVVAIAGGTLLVLQQSSTPTQLDNSRLPTIEQALTRVPTADVPGHEVARMPRPQGSVRGFFLETKGVVSVVYSQHQELLEVKQSLQPLLSANGWKPVGIGPSPGTQPESARSWRDVYSQGASILQVSMFRNGDVTATTYVLQTSTP